MSLENTDLQAELVRHFRYPTFRPGQEDIVGRVLSGRSVLVVMPTGSGKSLCYQLPALLLPGVSIVISPLIALMKDQVDALQEKELESATFINSSLSVDEQRTRIQGLSAGRFKLVYIAPERFRSGRFVEALTKIPVSLFVVDEAHCISEWGHDFRPDYLHCREVIPQIGASQVVALTATATARVQDDIVRQLGVDNMERVVRGFNRTNLLLDVRYAVKEGAKLSALKSLLQEEQRSGIIYVGTRRQAEEIADFASTITGTDVPFYHGGMRADERTRVQEQFMSGNTEIVVATNAFGMGIDRADIRFIYHYSLPASVEAYYQEAGRAGRDGKDARCVLIYSPEDRALQEYFIKNDSPTRNELLKVFDVLRSARGPDGFTIMSAEALDARLGLHETKTRVAVSLLEKIGAARRWEDTSDGMRLEMLQDSLPTAPLRKVFAEVESRRRNKREKLHAIVNYAETNRCRRRLILSYFGDHSEVENLDRCCDNCSAEAPTASPAEDAAPESSAVAHTILECVTRLSFPLGKEKLGGLLRGSKAKWVHELNAQRSESYGKLSEYTGPVLRTFIDTLLEAGLLKVIGGEFPVLALTPTGKQTLQQHVPVALPMPAPKLKPRPEPSVEALTEHPFDPNLCDRLRSYRSSKARELGMPPFMIFHDAALRAITKYRPDSPEALLEIPGLGPAKLDAYGDDILSIVSSRPAASPTPAGLGPRTPAPTQPTPAEASTVEQTWELFAQGMTPDKIAGSRGLTVGTIYTHLLKLIQEGRVQASRVVDPGRRRQIEQATGRLGRDSLKALKDALPPDLTYDEIRCVIAGMEAAEVAAPAGRGAERSARPDSRDDEDADIDEEVKQFLAHPHPRVLQGNWDAGYAVDFTSKFEGNRWTRTETGELIYRLKYRGEKALAGQLAERLAEAITDGPLPKDIDCLVPVPPSPSEREFDPMTELVVALSAKCGIPVNFGALERTKATVQQKKMQNQAQKEKNVRGVFAAQNVQRLRGRNLLIVDDFYDSGATLQECTRVLKAAGAKAVYVLTVGKTIHH